MYVRHVSQHDLPISVQESRKKSTNNRLPQLTTHSSAYNRREFRVNVYPQKKMPKQDKIDDHYLITQNYEDTVHNHSTTSSFVREVRQEREELEVEIIDNLLEDEINNNSNNKNSKQSQHYNVCNNCCEIQCEDKCIQTTCFNNSNENRCTQTDVVINRDTSVIAYNQIIDKNFLNRTFKINVKKFNSKNKCKIKHCISKEQMKQKASSTSNNNGNSHKISTRVTGCQTDPFPIITSNAYNLKTEELTKFTTILPQLFFCIVILLAGLCTATLIIKLFLIPHLNYICEQISVFFSPKQQEVFNFRQKLLTTLLKPVIFAYQVIFDIL